jgi:DNA-directed RNA polymerase beta subunit
MNEIKPEFLSISGINSFCPNTSSPRGVMDSHHFSSHLPLINPDKKLIQTGIEYELGKYINDVKADHDCIVKALVPRYPELGQNIPSYTLLVEYEKNDHIYIDYIEVKTFDSYHSVFGYKLTPTEEFANIGFNSPIAKDTILSKTESLNDAGTYDYGLNTNVAFMSHPSVSEDGFVVSESFIERCKFRTVTKRVININKNTIPINLYGDENVFKFIPSIGDPVRQDGLLCALRERNDWFSISDLSDENLMEPDMVFDTLTYVNTDSKVIDIKVTKGTYNKPEFSSKITEQLDDYFIKLQSYYQNLVGKFEQIMNEKKTIYGDNVEIHVSPKLHRLITDSMIKIQTVQSNKIRLEHRRLPIDQYRVEVTIESIVRPNHGYKLTDIHAAKGVICKILPDDAMPVDKNGNRADIITDPTSTISRMNIGRNYEAYLGATSRDNRNYLINYLTLKHGDNYLNTIDQSDLIFFKEYIGGLYALINPDMVEFLNSLNDEELMYHFREILTDDLYLYYPVNNKINIVDVIESIEKSKYKPLNDKVTYIDDFGRSVETKEDIRIGKFYVMLLEKIANTYSAVSSSKVNNFGFPIKGGAIDKHKYPHSLTPTKTLSETETRIITSLSNPELISDLVDLTLNPISHKLLIKHILESEKAFDPEFNIDRTVIDYGQTKSLMMLKHIFNAYGLDYKYVSEDECARFDMGNNL